MPIETLWDINKAARRTAILDAARKIILDGGVDDLSMRKLAAAAKVNVRTIYNIIGNQSDVFAAIVAEMVEVMKASVSSISRSSALERIEVLATAPMLLLFGNPRLFKPALRVVHSSFADYGRELFAPHSIPAMEIELQNAVALGLLMQTTPAKMLSQLIFDIGTNATALWSKDMLTDQECWCRLLGGLYMLLAGVAVEDIRAEIHVRLQQLLSPPKAVSPVDVKTSAPTG